MVSQRAFSFSPRGAVCSTNNIALLNPAITHNDGKVIKMATTQTTPQGDAKLLSVESMAKSLDTSVSHVYAVLKKNNVAPAYKSGRLGLYDASVLEQMKTAPRRRRQRRTLTAGEAPTSNLGIGAPKPATGLIERITRLEKALEKMPEMNANMERILKILGA